VFRPGHNRTDGWKLQLHLDKVFTWAGFWQMQLIVSYTMEYGNGKMGYNCNMEGMPVEKLS